VNGELSSGTKQVRGSVVALSLLVCLLQGSAYAQSKPVVWYKIDANLKLDDRGRPSLIDGREELTWLNDSPDRITELQFHLYLNAFKNEKSTFFRESGGELRGDRFKSGEWGWIDIILLQIAGGEDLTSRIEFIHPDDDNADDQTVVRVPLSKPILPNEKITLNIAFKARLPRVFARTGYAGSFAMVAQWFPKLGVWESKGARHRDVAGWNCHQFHATSEFYADFAVFDVTFTVPAVYKDKVGSTGILRSAKMNGDGTITFNYFQQDVHDFAWSVDSSFIKVVRTFHEVGSSTDVTLLIQEEHADQIDRHFNAAFNALRYFGSWYGAYPYQTLTIIDPPYNGQGAGGMEYPTLVTAGTRWRLGRDHNPEAVIVHEVGHQWWYGMVASNEFEEPWLDEGFNTYSTGKVLAAAYGRDVLPFYLAGVNWFYFPFELPHPFEDRILTLHGSFTDPILRPSWRFADSQNYAVSVYSRTGLALRTLENYVGDERMSQIMRTYFERWRYRHPASQDFFDVAIEISGVNLNWFFDQFVKGTATIDYELSDVESDLQSTRSGIYDRDGRKTEVESEDGDKTVEGAVSQNSYQHTITVRRLGEGWFPVDLHVFMTDGSSFAIKPTGVHDGNIDYQIQHSSGIPATTDSWQTAERWKKFRLTSKSQVRTAVVDPQNKVWLDANLTNNGWSEASGIKGALRWSGSSLFWVQVLAQVLSLLS
jgi:Peptidase family M1 domain